MDTGRLPSITEDRDYLALSNAHEQGGALPVWIAVDTLAAFRRAGYLDPEHLSQLSQLGMDTAAEWIGIKQHVAKQWRRGGALAPVEPGEDADLRRARRTHHVEEHYTPTTDPAWRHQ